MYALRAAILAPVLGLGCLLMAQDPHFTQFYAVPTYLSPAFAGTTVQSRFALQFRDQWPAIPGAFVSYAFAADQYLSAGWNMGDIQAIRVNGTQLETASDPRGRGVGMVVK